MTHRSLRAAAADLAVRLNLHRLCRRHHRLKHISRWNVQRTDNGTTTWTSPTGNTRTADPPPF